MITIKKIYPQEIDIIKKIVSIHIETFPGFFLTFMGRGFLVQLYKSFVRHSESDLLVAFENNSPVGFLAFSGDYSGLLKFLIKTRLVLLTFYSFGAFLRRPKVFVRLIRALFKPSQVKRKERFIELASIGVSPHCKAKGIGTRLVYKLKSLVDFEKYNYISLETDALNNDNVINFYLKNGFIKHREFKTAEGRIMSEYRYSRDN